MYILLLDLSNVPLLMPKAQWKPKSTELAILQLKAAWMF